MARSATATEPSHSLQDEFGLTATDAGFRAAGFVALATLLRPIGGLLSDHIGGARVLSGVFQGIVPFALLLAWPEMPPFAVGALACAALFGNGNGAVFKLVPQYFPRETGTVIGSVGAFGGMGGFFPPLALGFFRDPFGAIWPGFILLAVVAMARELTNLSAAPGSPGIPGEELGATARRPRGAKEPVWYASQNPVFHERLRGEIAARRTHAS